MNFKESISNKTCKEFIHLQNDVSHHLLTLKLEQKGQKTKGPKNQKNKRPKDGKIKRPTKKSKSKNKKQETKRPKD